MARPLNFEFKIPTRVIFGQDCIKNIGMELQALKIKRIALITDKGVVSAGISDKIKNILSSSQIEVVKEFSEIEPDPTIEVVEKGYKEIKGLNCEALIGIGGGSVLDSAKAIDILLTYGGKVEDYCGIGLIPGDLKPLIAIPTTSGTGSEVTFYAVIKDERKKVKFGLTGPQLAAKLAFVDPKLTVTLPANQTAACGIDALSHAIEGYLSNYSQPPSQVLALKAIELIAKNLRRAVYKPKDIQAREAMALASNLAGMVLANSLAGTVHALAHSLGGLYKIPHGICCALFLTEIMRFNSLVSLDKFPDLASALGINTNLLTPRTAVEEAIKEVKKLIEDIGISVKLSSYGVKREDILTIVQLAVVDSNNITNPRRVTEKELGQILEKIY